MNPQSLGNRYQGEFRRSDLLSELAVCGERFPFRHHLESGGGHTVTLPTGDVRGTWGEATGAAMAYVIAERPAAVVKTAADVERVHAVHAEYAAGKAEQWTAAAVAVGTARAGMDVIRAFAQRIDWDSLTEEQYESAKGAIREAEQGLDQAEKRFADGDAERARWGVSDVLGVVRWFGLAMPETAHCVERAPEQRAVATRPRPVASEFLLSITRPDAAPDVEEPIGAESLEEITEGATVAEESTGGEPAEMSAQVLAGMPRNAGVLFHEAAERGWDVRAERHWTGRAWARRIVVTGLVMVRNGVEEVEHVAVWSEDKGGFMSSASSAGFKDVRSAVAAQMPVSREAEESGRTVWGRDAATWVRELNTAVAKITAGLADVRDAYDALDGTGPVGRRAVEIAGAAYREASDAERRAGDAVKAARAWLADSNGEDARGCAAWRRLIVLATKCVTDAAETIGGAADRAGCEELAAPVIGEAQERLNAEEAAWRERLAAEGREPTAHGYGSLIQMFEDSARDWAAWFDGYTDYHDVAHAPQGDASLSMVAQYDAWGAQKAARSNGRQVSFPSRYTSASNLASGRQDAAAVAFALAVGEHIVAPDDDDVSPVGRGTRTLLADIAAVRRDPEGFTTAKERKHLAEWVEHPHGDRYRPRADGFAEHAPELWEAYETAARAYEGVDHFRHALVWDRKYAAERAEEIRQADDEGLAGLTAAREARRLSGREEEEWAAAVERFTTARVRVHEASVLAAGDVERAEACGERVRDSDALAEDVRSAVGFCRRAYDDVHRAKRDADHYAESAEIYREAGRLADYVAECVRVEDAAQRAQSGREETLNLYGCAFDDATRAEEARQTACTADVAGQVAAAVEVIAFHQSPGVVGRIVCQCGAVHQGYFPLRARGLNGEQPSGMADLTDWDIDDALAARGLAASVDRDQWSRGVLVSSENGTAGFATRIPVTTDQPAAEAYEASRAERQQATQAAPVEEEAPEGVDVPDTAEEDAAPAELSALWADEAVAARTQAIEFAATGTRQPKGSPVRPVEGERGVWECGGRFYSVSHNGQDESLWGDGYPNTVHDITEARARRGGFGPAAPIVGHAHGTADARKLIRMYAREVVALIADQEAEAVREAERAPIASLSGTGLTTEQVEQANGMAPTVADAAGPSGELARRTTAELAAAGAHSSRFDTPQADAETDGQEAAEDAETDGRCAQLRAALIEGETIAPVSFTDQREPAAGWILTTAGGHTFRLRPVTYSLPDNDQWEAGHDADGSYWWAANIDDQPLSTVLARIREDSATRIRFASLWARYGHLTAQAPQFETTTDRVQLEEGVYLIRRFGRIGLIASCRWGWEHLTDPDGAQGCTGEDWSRRSPDNRQYVAEWKIWYSAQDAISNARLRVVAQLTDDMADTPDAYCDASAPYVGKCSAKRSGARYTVAVVTDQEVELGRYTVCARCLSHRLLNEKDGRIGHHDVQSLVEALAKGDPKVCALHWEQWPDRIAEVAGQMLSAALDAGEAAPWPAQALADQIVAEACEAGDDRAKREARAEVKAAGGDAKAQKRAAEEAVAARQDRAALVAGQGAAGRGFSARIRAESAGKETVRQLEAGNRAKAEEAASETSEWASVAIEAAEAAIAAGYELTENSARAHMEAANEAARAAVATLTGLADSGVAGSDAAPEPAEEAPEVVDVKTLTVTRQVRNGEPSTYEFTVDGPGLTIGKYQISHDCQGKGARGIMWRASWHGVEPSGRWDVIGIGSGEGKGAALTAVAEHAGKAGGDLAAAFTVARRMRYDAGLWVLPEVGDSEAIQYHPDGSWTITAETGAPYTVRREWRGRDATNDLAPLLIEDQAGALVASCTAVDGYMSAWAPMLERLRLHAAAVADGVPHATAVTPGGPTQEWVEAWCVCGWTERADVAKYADRAPAGEALALEHRQAHYPPETSVADATQELLAGRGASSRSQKLESSNAASDPRSRRGHEAAAPANRKQPPAEGRPDMGEAASGQNSDGTANLSLDEVPHIPEARRTGSSKAVSTAGDGEIQDDDTSPVEPELAAGSGDTNGDRTRLQALEQAETRPVRQASKREEKPKRPEDREEPDALFDLAQLGAQKFVIAPDHAHEQNETPTARTVGEVEMPGQGEEGPNTGEGGSFDVDDRDGGLPNDGNHSTLHDLGAYASEPLVDEAAAAAPGLHPALTLGEMSPAVTAPLEDSRTPVPNARPADTLLRPGRLLHADGTPLFLHQSFPDKAMTPHTVTAHGAAPAPSGTGEWQVVLDEEGNRLVVHPALISHRDTPRYPGINDPDEVARWEALDSSEAADEGTANLPARQVRPGDRLAVTRRVKEKVLTEYIEVTEVGRRASGSGRSAAALLEFTVAGPRGGTRKVAHEPTNDVSIEHPAAHPAVVVPTDGRPITTRLLRGLWADGPQRRLIHNLSTLQLVAEGQFALHQQTDTSWELLPATTAHVIWPSESEYIYGFEGEPPWPLAGFPDMDQAKEFADRLTTLFCHGGPGSMDFASPSFPETAAAWHTKDGAPLYLALLGERAHFDRVHGRADSHAAEEYLKFEPGARPHAPAGHQWADQLKVGEVILFERDDCLEPFGVKNRSVSPNGLVSLTLDSEDEDTVLLARNMTVPSDTAHPVGTDGAPYADIQAGWAVPEGAWVELDPAGLDSNLQQSLEHPQLREPGARVRARLSGRDDAEMIRLNDVRLVTADQERHPLAIDLAIEQPDLLVRLRTLAASAEEQPPKSPELAPNSGSRAPTWVQSTPTAPDSSPASQLLEEETEGSAEADTVTAEDSTPVHRGVFRPSPPESVAQHNGIPSTPSPPPEPDHHPRAQEIADDAAAATLPEQVRAHWASARAESLPADTTVGIPEGLQPLLPYLAARRRSLATFAAPSDAGATDEAATPAPPAVDTAEGITEGAQPLGTDLAETLSVPTSRLYQMASLSFGSKESPASPTALIELDGITVYHMVSSDPPQGTDRQAGSRWLYLGLTDDTSNLAIPIAVISHSDFSDLAPAVFEQTVSAWARAADPDDPKLVSLFEMAARSSQDHEPGLTPAAPGKATGIRARHSTYASLIARTAQQGRSPRPEDRGNSASDEPEQRIHHHRADQISGSPSPSTKALAHARGVPPGSEATLSQSAPQGPAKERLVTPPSDRAEAPSPTATPAANDSPQVGPQTHATHPQEPQAEQVVRTEDGSAYTAADSSGRRTDQNLSELREQFRALTASIRETAESTRSTSPARSTSDESAFARRAAPADLAHARADLDPHLDTINNSPRATPQMRTDLAALIKEIDQTLPELNHRHAAQRRTLLSRTLDLLVRTAKALRDLAANMRVPAASQRIEELTERLRDGRREPIKSLRAARADRCLHAFARTQRFIETRLATPGLTSAERQSLQEDWILNRARWHGHHKARHGEPPEGLIPHDRLRIAGYPTTPAARTTTIEELSTRLRSRACTLSAVPGSTAQAELFLIMAGAYEQLARSTPSMSVPREPGSAAFRRQSAAERPDIRVAARRLADEVTQRAEQSAGSATPPRGARSNTALISDEQRMVRWAAVPAGHGRPSV
ncbi:hypothetical protein PUR49_32560 [Streptomyces sp. BE147]|uniref:hypothetical protein n=1 Tax=Streptomyces sp. BE147 TaxID=3002524 RepID=UPI002E766AD3|nr:hypothetical protein [Streptomyces sp. BE147]MEE1741205.1 hypothetical protein [Streptomyces sp. BE147]